MLVDVEPFFFNTFGNAETVYPIESFEDEKSHAGCPCTYYEGSKYLCSEESPACTIKESFARRQETCENGTCETSDPVYGTCTNGIVNLQHFIDELNREYHQDATDCTDDDSTQRRNHFTACRDTYQTCQDTIQSQG